MTVRDMQRLKEIIETGRVDSENPEYKIIKILCDELEIILKDYDGPFISNPTAVILDMVRR